MFLIDIPILAYHRIVPGSSSKNLGEFGLPASNFERHMRYLHEHGYVCLSLADLSRDLDNGRSRRRRTVALTFDDGHKEFFTLAYPILHDYGFTSTVFLVTNWTREQSDLEHEGNSHYLTWEQIDVLHKGGISFGSHTCTHSWLPGLSREQVWRELTASKECLGARLGQEIQWLAYPFGASTSEIQKMAEDAGYKAAYGIARGKSGRFNMWRRICRRDDSLVTFALKLNPWYHYPGHLREDTQMGWFLHKVKHRIGF